MSIKMETDLIPPTKKSKRKTYSYRTDIYKEMNKTKVWQNTFQRNQFKAIILRLAKLAAVSKCKMRAKIKSGKVKTLARAGKTHTPQAICNHAY